MRSAGSPAPCGALYDRYPALQPFRDVTPQPLPIWQWGGPAQELTKRGLRGAPAAVSGSDCMTGSMLAVSMCKRGLHTLDDSGACRTGSAGQGAGAGTAATTCVSPQRLGQTSHRTASHPLRSCEILLVLGGGSAGERASRAAAAARRPPWRPSSCRRRTLRWPRRPDPASPAPARRPRLSARPPHTKARRSRRRAHAPSAHSAGLRRTADSGRRVVGGRAPACTARRAAPSTAGSSRRGSPGARSRRAAAARPVRPPRHAGRALPPRQPICQTLCPLPFT
jgi:hypothetical protein